MKQNHFTLFISKVSLYTVPVPLLYAHREESNRKQSAASSIWRVVVFFRGRFFGPSSVQARRFFVALPVPTPLLVGIPLSFSKPFSFTRLATYPSPDETLVSPDPPEPSDPPSDPSDPPLHAWFANSRLCAVSAGRAAAGKPTVCGGKWNGVDGKPL